MKMGRPRKWKHAYGPDGKWAGAKRSAIARTRADKRGRKAFVPTPEQRHVVGILTGARMTHDELCQLIVGPGTLKPICKNTMERAFAPELAAGKSKLNLS